MRKYIIICIFIIILVENRLLFVNDTARCENEYFINDTIGSINVEMGIPIDDNSDDDLIVRRRQYVLSFNNNLKVCNWVSWNLNKEWYGDAERYHKFIKDPEVDEDFQANDKDYRKSGYDKGHVVRSEERTATKEDNITTFFYTNILPQTPLLNRNVWYEFERYCEKLCKVYNKELYIIAGGIFSNEHKTIGNGIAVPDTCYKIVVIMEKGQKLEDVNEKTTIISVKMPNDNSVRNKKWDNFTTTVRMIEFSTGYNYLNNVREEIQEVIENKESKNDIRK